MRQIKLLLAGAAVALLAIAAGSPSVAAQEGDAPSEEEIIHEAEVIVKENGGSEFEAECVALLAEGRTIDDCQAAPNPLVPPINELIWGAVAFLAVFALMAKFGYPAMKRSLDARTERIRADLAAAETQRTEADTLLAEYRAQLNDAKTESARIIEEARQSADALKRDQEARLQSELADLRTKAAADIDAAKVQAIADLRGEVAQLAIGAAEVVVGKTLDQGTQMQLIEDYINQVANQR